jgi:hypothetical protein
MGFHGPRSLYDLAVKVARLQGIEMGTLYRAALESYIERADVPALIRANNAKLAKQLRMAKALDGMGDGVLPGGPVMPPPAPPSAPLM